jgi:hypothetical protein
LTEEEALFELSVSDRAKGSLGDDYARDIPQVSGLFVHQVANQELPPALATAISRRLAQTTLAVALAVVTSSATALDFTVNSTGDGADASPGDGQCATDFLGSICTLHAAICHQVDCEEPGVASYHQRAHDFRLRRRWHSE